jgi:hypothetical protein
MTSGNDSAPQANITLLIEQANAGDNEALNHIFTALYPELHNLARARLRRAAHSKIKSLSFCSHAATSSSSFL